MLKPFYQGKLDVFCAIYAVLNGLRLTHNLRTSKARDILNETLLGISASPMAFQAFLAQKTDYVAVVDAMLARLPQKYPLEVVKPFAGSLLADRDTFWQTCKEWLNPEGKPASNRAAIFRFSKYLKPGASPLVRHWTTVDRLQGDVMHLFDSSHDAESIQNLHKDKITASARDIDPDHLIYVQPDTLRFLRLPY